MYMKVKKLGHCCLIIEVKGKRIMTDPGSYTVDIHKEEKNIDIVLITHEHGDHLHLNSITEILENNPNAKIITNESVGKKLAESGISFQILEDKVSAEVLGVEIEAHDCKHEEIFEEMGQVQNTGFFINKILFYPGDAFYNPGKPVKILALGVGGPWSRVRDFMKYVLELKPEICIPVHDGMLNTYSSSHSVPKNVLPKFNIKFEDFEKSNEVEF
jgi:L-ascorbate metabolism protein UlaG (beta-lactamase superfamily)